jgi:hypothetical protein
MIMARSIIQILIGIFVLIFGLLLLSLVCGEAEAGNLNGQAGYESVLYNLLHASSTHADWTEAKIDECINLGITFVEGVSKANEVHDTITFNINESAAADTGFCYALSADARSGGVLNVLYFNSNTAELMALSKRNIEDFGKDAVDGKSPADFTYMYSEAFDTLLVYPIPDRDDVMHVISYKVSDWMSGTDTTVTLPLFHRLLALEMAYGYAQLSTGTAEGFQRFTAIKESVLQALYGLPPEPEAQVQSLGIEGQ